MSGMLTPSHDQGVHLCRLCLLHGHDTRQHLTSVTVLQSILSSLASPQTDADAQLTERRVQSIWMP